MTSVGYLCVALLFHPGWMIVEASGGPVEGFSTERPWIFGSADPFSQPIFTDRPTFSVGTGTITRGRVQIESGYTFSFEDAHPDVQTHSFFETLLRIGFLENLELRLEWPTLIMIENGENSTGLRDLGLGFKTGVLSQHGLLPEISIAGRVSFPTGDKNFSSDRVDPEFRTLLAYTLSQRVALFSNITIAGPTSQHTRFVQVASSLGVSTFLREGLTGFMEYFGFYPRDVASGSGHYLQTGLLYLFSYNLQLDCRLGGGLTHGTDDFFSGVGFSWRF